MIPESMSEVASEAYSEDFDEASGSRQSKMKKESQMQVQEPERGNTAGTEKARPSGIQRETPAFEIITIENVGDNAGIDSPFVSNTKQLVKYQLSHEIIESLKNVVNDTIKK